VDDLPQLVELWKAAQLPATVLDKQFTDFQVAEDDHGTLVAAIAMQIEDTSGRIHSETFADFGLTDTLRPSLWERLQIVAKNHGLFRLWTEESAPWWKKDAGFAPPSQEILQKLPPSFGAPHPGWLTLRLKDESADPERLEKEIALFKEAERVRREKLVSRGRALRIFGTILSALILIFALGFLFYVLRNRRH
jgi:hypothetical protein